ncbi:MAG: DUF1343 domain-containing protein [Verrucomicrobiota bacterium]
MSNSVILPVDRLGEVWPAQFREKRVGALLHSASTTANFRPTLDVLLEESARQPFTLSALFGPQHGFQTTTQDNMIEWEGAPHAELGIPIFSLYGEHRKPTAEMLASIDVLFVDLVDVGARYYTYIWTLLHCMEACEEAGIPVIVADRPNPINGITIEGEPQRTDHLSFVGLHPIPIRHGTTIGELALLFREERTPNADLTILPLQGWERNQWYDETGLPWTIPSPNMPTLDTAIVYPGMCLLEATNLSEGRGTTRPFELIGAPWINRPSRYAQALRDLALPGVTFRETHFQPTFQKHAGEPCGGVQVHVTDRNSFLPVRTAIDLLRTTQDHFPEHFAWNPPPYEYETEKLPIDILLGHPHEDLFPR